MDRTHMNSPLSGPGIFETVGRVTQPSLSFVASTSHKERKVLFPSTLHAVAFDRMHVI